MILKSFYVAWYQIKQKIDKNITASWEYLDDEIKYNPENFWEDKRNIMIHELLHAILEKYAFTETSNPIIPPIMEEQFVSIFAKEINKNLPIIEHNLKRI